MVSDKRLTSTSVDKYDPITIKSQCRTNNLVTTYREENSYGFSPLDILNLQREQQTDTRDKNSKVSSIITDQGFSYSKPALEKVELILCDIKIYIPQSLLRRVIYW